MIDNKSWNKSLSLALRHSIGVIFFSTLLTSHARRHIHSEFLSFF